MSFNIKFPSELIPLYDFLQNELNFIEILLSLYEIYSKPGQEDSMRKFLFEFYKNLKDFLIVGTNEILLKFFSGSTTYSYISGAKFCYSSSLIFSD